jgi:surfeit locus 1 family protein
MKKPRFHKPKAIPLVMSIGAIVLLFGLGAWQLQRLAWKENLIADMESAATEAPLEILPEDAARYQFRTVRLTGEYLSHEFHLAARYFRDQLGYVILTPLRLADGRIVLINRGWIPAAK